MCPAPLTALASHTGVGAIACWTAVVESATLPLHILVDHAEFKAGMSTGNGVGVGMGIGSGTAIGAGAGVPHSHQSRSKTSQGATGWRIKKK